MRHAFSTCILIALTPIASAQPFKMEPGPKSPQDSLKCIQTRPGFKVELMVAEPLVMDPIAFAWGPDGKFWVVEMGDYPLGVDGKNKAGGKIKYLEKTKADGPYDKMTLFMDNVGYPTGVFPYDKGVLVTCAPDIFYAEVGKDGKAANKKVLFTGFKEGNQQHRVNGLTWGIDNWIYGANGDSGGIVKSIKTGKSVNISGRDFRLKVETGEFEAVSGQSQFGRCRDDWGNWFGNNNSNPMFHYVLEDRYLKRNPHVLYPDPRVAVSVKPGASEVFPISKPLPRFNSPQALNHFTSACSTIIYRDTLFGKEFEGNMFVSEPVHNLIHREIMKPKGVTFTSQRADDEQKSEFLASSDNWFRPTMIQVGPDGALWIADMYRYVIEHPEWIPKDWQKKLDLRAGHDLGRIYRVYPDVDQLKPDGKFRPKTLVRPIPTMDGMSTNALLAALKNPNGWVRDTAHQLLLERKDDERQITGDCINMLVPPAKRFEAPAYTRVHALYILQHFKRMERLDFFLQDPHPAVRKHAVALFEEHGVARDKLPFEAIVKDPDDALRMQLAYSAAKIHEIDPRLDIGLAKMLNENAHDRYLLAATLTSLTKERWPKVFNEIVEQKAIPAALYVPLMALAGEYDRPADVSKLFLRQLNASQVVTRGERFRHVGDLLDAMERNGISLKKMLEKIGDRDVELTMRRLQEIYDEANTSFNNSKSPPSEQLLALRLLARGLGDDKADYKNLASWLTPQRPDDLQGAVVQHLSKRPHPRAAETMLASWKSYSPPLRGQVLDALFTTPYWTGMMLEAIEKNKVPASEIDAIRRQRLLQHKDAHYRQRAEKVFGSSSSPDRGKVVDLYALQMPAKTDAERGKKLFEKSCASCHKFGATGNIVGPDLASVGDKSVSGLLTAILDPNRAVEARYINYAATTKAGKTYSGIIASETSTSITLVGPDGKSQQLLRNELDELASTGKSLMPDGLEKDLSVQDVADIIAFIRASAPGGKKIDADKDGVFRLLPADARIFGKTIVIEKKYGNFGFWSNPDDHVEWSVNVPKAGEYDVWIYFACADDSAGNTLQFRCYNERLTFKVPSTGSWDEYRGQKIGKLFLHAGAQEIEASPAGKIRGSLIDLKKVELSPR